MSFRSGCAFFAISDCPYSLGMSCLHVRLAVSFSCHMHSQCVAMGAASYVKLSRAFTTSKCNFRQWTKGFNGTHSVKPSQFSRLLVLSNPFHKIVNDTSLCRSTGTLNRGPNAKQKISFSRKFPFMKSRERLNKLDDDESFENGSNHRYKQSH